MILIGCEGYGWALAGGAAHASTLANSAATTPKIGNERIMSSLFDLVRSYGAERSTPGFGHVASEREKQVLRPCTAGAIGKPSWH